MSENPPALPQTLTTFRGIIPEPTAIGAAEGMGEWEDPRGS